MSEANDPSSSKEKTDLVSQIIIKLIAMRTLGTLFSICYPQMSGEPKEILWKRYVCSRQGVRDCKITNNTNLQREARANTRCGCNASFCVHVDVNSGRWLVSFFEHEHNHELLRDKFVGRLHSHRGMSDAVLAGMNNMRNVGISTPKIFVA